MSTSVLFRWGVTGGDGARPNCGVRASFVEFHQAKIYQHGFTARSDANVGGFNIAVQNWWGLFVQIVQRFGHLKHPAHRGRNGNHLLLFQNGRQVFAFDVIHHQVLSFAGNREVIGYAGQIGVREIR